MAGLLVSHELPRGTTSLTAWLEANGRWLGRRYLNEVGAPLRARLTRRGQANGARASPPGPRLPIRVRRLGAAGLVVLDEEHPWIRRRWSTDDAHRWSGGPDAGPRRSAPDPPRVPQLVHEPVHDVPVRARLGRVAEEVAETRCVEVDLLAVVQRDLDGLLDVQPLELGHRVLDDGNSTLFLTSSSALSISGSETLALLTPSGLNWLLW